jgi:hypothetical protein
MMAAISILAVIYLPTEMVVLPAYYSSLGDPAGLGLLISAMAAASIIGALFFEQIHKFLSYSTILRIGILGVPLAMLPMSQLPAQSAMFVGALVLGLAWGPLLPLLNTVIQRKIPANFNGCGWLGRGWIRGSAHIHRVSSNSFDRWSACVIQSAHQVNRFPEGNAYRRFATESMISVGRNGYLAISASSEMPVLTRMV